MQVRGLRRQEFAASREMLTRLEVRMMACLPGLQEKLYPISSLRSSFDHSFDRRS